MRLLRHAIQRGSRALILAAVLGAIGGVLSAALLSITAASLQATEVTMRGVLAFVGVTIAAAVVRYASAIVSLRYTGHEIADLSFSLCRAVVNAPLRSVEELGSDRLMVALHQDIATMTRALMDIPALVTNAIVVISCCVYLALSSHAILLLVLVCAAVSIVPHLFIKARAHAAFAAARREHNEVMGHYRALTDGIAELKLHRPRRAAFLSDALLTGLSAIERLDLRAQSLYAVGNSYRHAVFVLAAAPVIFGAPLLHVDRGVATAAVLTLFYLRGPIDGVMNALPTIARGDVAAQNFEAIRAALAPEKGESVEQARPIARVTRVDLVGVRYTYSGPDGFSIGPIDLTIRAGETLFIAGGNGSGKTTLAKVIAGLYEPSEGALYVDGRLVDETNRDEYRQLLSCVFARFHLFRRLLGVDPRHATDCGNAWLRRLDLDGIVRLDDGVFSTVDLSSGQRKRLALLVALLDDRPICVFDEWAAEQDPEYRDEFYTRVLPELRAAGKLVIVVTHDDRYFSTGDAIVRMERGRIAAVSDSGLVPTPITVN